MTDYMTREGALRVLSRATGRKVGRRVLERLLARHRELEPDMRLAGKRVYTPEEVKAIARVLRARVGGARRSARRAG